MPPFSFGNANDDFEIFDPSHADAVLANDLNRMSVQERNVVLDDVHGVGTMREEESNPQMMLAALERMNVAIHQIQRKPAFDEACRLDSQYVLRDHKFRMKFLRADEYDVNLAAQRFVDHLDIAYELFGNIALMRPLVFDDLTKEEQNEVKDGCQQLLPFRDPVGRRIMVRVGNLGKPGENQVSAKNMRVNLYVLQEMSLDERTQQYGMVWILFSAFEEEETKFLKEPNIKDLIRKFLAGLPVRITAIHLCLPNTPTYVFAAAAISLISPTFMRVRVRKHLGSVTECKYSLMTYGIPADQVPITASGRLKTTNHIRWLKTIKEREASLKVGIPFHGLDCPGMKDILIGNAGHSFRNNPGNRVYREVLQSYFAEYNQASDTQERTRITWRVLEELSRSGCRLLFRDRRGWWLVASTDKAREKISYDFREARKRMLADRKRTNVDTSTTAFLDGGKRIRIHDGEGASATADQNDEECECLCNSVCE